MPENKDIERRKPDEIERRQDSLVRKLTEYLEEFDEKDLANVEEPDLQGWDLHRAAYENRVNIAQALISRGDDVDANSDKYGTGCDSPLRIAAMRNSHDVAKLLIANNADKEAEGPFGTTPLQMAAYCHAYDVTKLLLEAGANIEANVWWEESYDMEQPPLYVTFYQPWRSEKFQRDFGVSPPEDPFAVAMLLIDHGANVNGFYTNQDYWNAPLLVCPLPPAGTPLGLAGEKSNNLFLRLLQEGASVNVFGAYGENPLIDAISSQRLDVVELLIDCGADVNWSHKYVSITPLHAAAQQDLVEIAQLLIKNGAKLDAKIADDAHPYSHAQGDLSEVFPHRATPLYVAADQKSIRVARLLIKHGANIDGIDLNWMDDQKNSS